MSGSPTTVQPNDEEVTSGGGGGGEGHVVGGKKDGSSVMEVDIDPELLAASKGDDESIEKSSGDKDSGDIGDVVSATNKVTLEEKADEFVVLEEEDGDGEGEEDDEGKDEDTPEGGKKTETGESESNPESAEVILVNPLFGKDSVPVIDVDDSSSGSDDDHDEDFSDAMQVNGLHKGTDCGCGCQQEKGILIAEIERLRNAIGELGSRQSVLEDFIHVEYADKFQTFLKNRDHLMSMGFGASDSDPLDGKRSGKSTELVELLSMIKEQSDPVVKEHKGASKSKSASGNSGGSTSQNKSPSSSISKGGKMSGGNNKQVSNPRPIPSLNSNRSRDDRGANQGWDHLPQQSGPYPVIRPEVEMIGQVRGAVPLVPSQYQQQMLIAQQQQLHAATQARYHAMQEAMYRTQNRDPGPVAIQRTSLFSQVPGNNIANTGFGGVVGAKRKRNSQGSGGGSVNSSNNVPNPLAAQQQFALMGKKKCPLCTGVMKAKKLKDHLLSQHSPAKMKCPSCSEEFSMKKKLGHHLREQHNYSENDCLMYSEKCFAGVSEQVIPWVHKMVNQAKIPTIEQMNAHLRFNDEQKRLHGTAPSTGGVKPPSGPGERIFSGSRGHVSAASIPSTANMYGPGGYAQYAQRYLQERSGPTSRLYTPF